MDDCLIYFLFVRSPLVIDLYCFGRTLIMIMILSIAFICEGGECNA